jgi:hypothetical protein
VRSLVPSKGVNWLCYPVSDISKEDVTLRVRSFKIRVLVRRELLKRKMTRFFETSGATCQATQLSVLCVHSFYIVLCCVSLHVCVYFLSVCMHVYSPLHLISHRITKGKEVKFALEQSMKAQGGAEL